MTTQTIPAKTVTSCDGCGVVCTNDNRRRGGAIHVIRHALDMHGHAVASNDIKRDFCDSCLDTLTKALNEAFHDKSLKHD